MLGNGQNRVMACYGAKVTHMGGAGAGQLTKMVNQICIAGLVQGLSGGAGFWPECRLGYGYGIRGCLWWGSAILADGKPRNHNGAMSLILICGRLDAKRFADLYGRGCAKWLRAASNRTGISILCLLSHQGFGRNDTSSLIRLLKR